MLISKTSSLLRSSLARNAVFHTSGAYTASTLKLTPIAKANVQPIHTTPPPRPPQPSSTAHDLSNTSLRPTLVRSKPLPPAPNPLPLLATFILFALASWTAFTVYATNKEKLSSSIFKSVVSQVKNSPEIISLLSPPLPPSSSSSGGGASSTLSRSIVLKRETLLGGAAKINGSVNMMQGRVDLSFKIHLSGNEQDTATVYFTSIRAHKHADFEILRFVVVDDRSGESVSLLDRMGLRSIDVESGDLV